LMTHGTLLGHPKWLEGVIGKYSPWAYFLKRNVIEWRY
jgi:hypothetical protein